jgi:hypothetical protein
MSAAAPGGTPGTGTFAVHLTVTESDPSNAKALLEKAAAKVQAYGAKLAERYKVDGSSSSSSANAQSPNPMGL